MDPFSKLLDLPQSRLKLRLWAKASALVRVVGARVR